MKQMAIAAAIISALGMGAASANTGEVQFIGAVTDTTCNINPVVNGAVKNTIDLGTMKVDGTGADEVAFELVPDSQACLDKTSASVGWQSAGFDQNGLSNMKGDATGASIKITAVNSTTANQSVTSNMQTIDFGNGTDAIGSFEFTSQLVKNDGATATPGTVISSATYAVAYK